VSARAALDARREVLEARAAAERDAISAELEGWQRTLAGADRGLNWIAALRRYVPVAGVGAGLGLTALALARPRLVAGAFAGGLALWRVGRSVGRIFAGTRR
jgi:hypothetical protein